MKILLLLLSLVFLLKAQDEAKVPPKEPSEKIVSSGDLFEVRYTISEMSRLNKKFDMEGFHKEFDPIQLEQNNWIIAHCKEVGVTQEKMSTECKWNLGLDVDGKPMNGPDGKPVVAKFWRETPKKAEEKK